MVFLLELQSVLSDTMNIKEKQHLGELLLDRH